MLFNYKMVLSIIFIIFCPISGMFDDAIVAHKEEIRLSEACDDVIGIAVGNRKVGECFCELRQFIEAIEHQKEHLKVDLKYLSNEIFF